jgi:hypothetical protein
MMSFSTSQIIRKLMMVILFLLDKFVPLSRDVVLYVGWIILVLILSFNIKVRSHQRRFDY